MLDRLLAGPPDAGTAEALVGLEAEPLGVAELLGLIRGWDRVLGFATAHQLAAIARFAALAGVADPAGDEGFVLPELAAALRLSREAAQNRVLLAEDLEGKLAPTGQELAAGELTFMHILAAHRALADCTPEVAAAVQAKVLPGAGAQSRAEFDRAVRWAVAEVDPVTAEEEHAIAVAGRRVAVYPEEHGMATLAATLAAPDAYAAYAALTRCARFAERRDGAAGLPRDADPGRDARRADALIACCRRAEADPGLAGPVPDRGEVGVLIDLPTLLGVAQRPGELPGYGPIPASVARELAGDARWRRFVTDPVTGELLDAGAWGYVPSEPLRRFVTRRDRRCRFVGCARPAAGCDLDHVVPFDRGGATTRENLQPLCRYHHRAKTAGAWRAIRHPDGTTDWTGPAGIRYRVPPARYPPAG